MAKDRSKFQRKLDGFLRGLFFEENGKPKSAAFLYAFLLAVLFMFVCVLSFLLLLEPLEKAFAGASVTVRNIVEYTVPALVGSGICLLLTFKRDKRKLVASAYLFMAGLFAAVCLFELFVIDWSDPATEYGLFMAVLGLPALACVVSGGVPALLIYRRELKRQAEEEAKTERRSWYRI